MPSSTRRRPGALRLWSGPGPLAPATADGPLIVVDGGIRPHTVKVLAEAGADGVVPGSFVFGHPDPVAAIRELHGLGRTAGREMKAGASDEGAGEQ